MLLIATVVKGFIIALLYFETTRLNDTTLLNSVLFISFYTLMIGGAEILGIDPNIVTNAFITKTVFTLVDERIKRQNGHENGTK